MNLQVLPDDMLDFLDAPVPYIVSDFLFFCNALLMSKKYGNWNEYVDL